VLYTIFILTNLQAIKRTQAESSPMLQVSRNRLQKTLESHRLDSMYIRSSILNSRGNQRGLSKRWMIYRVWPC